MRVLIADDDRELASAIATSIRHWNDEVVATVTTGGLDVIRNVDRFQPDVVITDIIMPRLNGLTVCHHILSRFPLTKIILFSGRLSALHPHVVNSGARAFLAKPVKLIELRNVLENLANETAPTPMITLAPPSSAPLFPSTAAAIYRANGFSGLRT